MTAARRRDEILQALAGASGPVSAAALAARLGVSRQVVVGDVALPVLKGNTAILIDGMAKAMIVSSKNLPGRGVSEAETEVSVRGSKESFTESFRVNTVLIRRRIRDTRLKSRQMTIGVRSKTDGC